LLILRSGRLVFGAVIFQGRLERYYLATKVVCFVHPP
jgi:hypothetical protein